MKVGIDSVLINSKDVRSGRIVVRGAKNAVSKQMVATLLTKSPCFLSNVPEIDDVYIVKSIMESYGSKIEYHPREGTIKIDNSDLIITDPEKFREVTGKSRIPILTTGPLLHRFKTAFIPNLGGCVIGDRPIDFHIKSLEQMGALVSKSESGLNITSPKGLSGTTIELPYPSVGATEQILLSSVMAKGKTVLKNAAIEPEIVELIAVLQRMGAIISIEVDRKIIIEGVSEMKGFSHRVESDRIEISSWACLALLKNIEVEIIGANQLYLMNFLNIFRKIGGDYTITDSGITFRKANSALQPINLTTDVFPGFSTDAQQVVCLVLTQAHGTSIVHETVYENRFGFSKSLKKMGAIIRLSETCPKHESCRFNQKGYKHVALVKGPTTLKNEELVIPDLRAGFAYILAAVATNGVSTIHNFSLMKRGYEEIEAKLASFNIKVTKSQNKITP